MCCFRADMPESEGLKHLWFVLGSDELLGLVSGRSCTAQDGYHHLSVMGDLWSFYDLELETRKTSGNLPVRFYNVELPRFFARMLLRVAKATWTKMRANGETHGEKKLFEFTPEYLTKILRLYGQGKGKVEVSFSRHGSEDQTAREWAEKRAREDKGFAERLEYLKRIALNSTRAFYDTAHLYLYKSSRDESYFDWTACKPNGRSIMNGGLVLHSDGDWGIHT